MTMTARPTIFWANIGVKVALVALLAFALLFPNLPQFQGKAFGGRAMTYPIAALVVPAIYWLATRRRQPKPPYPYAVDILLVMPFLVDMAGNALNLYDTITWWDDLNHLVNWGIISAAFGAFLLRTTVGRWSTAGLVAGFGAITAILWELAEYLTFVRNSPELQTAYTDTLGDLVLGELGSIIAGLVFALVFWPRRQSD
jgi:hypothetical protein